MWNKDYDFCCNMMREKVLQTCKDHPLRSDCGDIVMARYTNGDFGIPIHPDAGGGYIYIEYCPWCGEHLYPI